MFHENITLSFIFERNWSHNLTYRGHNVISDRLVILFFTFLITNQIFTRSWIRKLENSTGTPRRRRCERSLVAPEQASIGAGALLGVQERAVRNMDLHELARRGFLSLHRCHVGVAHPRQPPVRRLDFHAGRGGADPQNLVQHRARSHTVMRAQIRSCLMSLLLRASGDGEGHC